MNTTLPIVIEPQALQQQLDAGNPKLLIVDLCAYTENYLPGAVALSYSDIVAGNKPVMGLVPDTTHLNGICSRLGIEPDTHVVAYDNEGNGKASRLLFTLDCLGHAHFSLLNGGLDAWLAEKLPTVEDAAQPIPSEYKAQRTDKPVANRELITAALADSNTVLLDTRSLDEYNGKDVRAARGGHIPGAVNMEWTHFMDPAQQRRLLPLDVLLAKLASIGVTPDKQVILYCQTHHRSAHTYVTLKHLGFKNLKGYPGAWSEWGNLADTPIESNR